MISEVLANRGIDTHCPLCGRPFTRAGSSAEHIFPKWLQHHHDLWTCRLTIPNFIGKTYESIKIKICERCNNKRYGKNETIISNLLRSPDAYAACAAIPDDVLAIWLGKIFWLLCRKSHSVEDFRTYDQPQVDRIIPDRMIPGTLYLGMIQRTFATKKRMVSCFGDDPPIPSLYRNPYSFYRFRIDTRDTKFETFDYADNVPVLGAALRSNTLGMICLFDGGSHRQFRAQHLDFAISKTLHPMQFNEILARAFYDQTVLDELSCRVTYFWNTRLRSVIAMNHTQRFYDPYLEVNHDPRRLAFFVGRHTFCDPGTIVSDDGERIFTLLKDQDGAFLQYPVTDEEIDAARRDPYRIWYRLDNAWRQRPLPERPTP
jgi:hypothetical protein